MYAAFVRSHVRDTRHARKKLAVTRSPEIMPYSIAIFGKGTGYELLFPYKGLLT